MKYTLGQAAKATGKAKSTILRAIKNGTISATKRDGGAYQIDPSELHRVFDPTSAQQCVKNDTQPPVEHAEILRLKIELLEQERARERSQLEDTISDLRGRLDRAEDRVTGLLSAPDTSKPRKRWLFWGE